MILFIIFEEKIPEWEKQFGIIIGNGRSRVILKVMGKAPENDFG